MASHWDSSASVGSNLNDLSIADTLGFNKMMSYVLAYQWYCYLPTLKKGKVFVVVVVVVVAVVVVAVAVVVVVLVVVESHRSSQFGGTSGWQTSIQVAHSLLSLLSSKLDLLTFIIQLEERQPLLELSSLRTLSTLSLKSVLSHPFRQSFVFLDVANSSTWKNPKPGVDSLSLHGN